ncbi:MAG: hypothetical protein IPH35_24320 [Rhodoferax sp.]|nr:hypothetical protein [Rhodoferax sp.]
MTSSDRASSRPIPSRKWTNLKQPSMLVLALLLGACQSGSITELVPQDLSHPLKTPDILATALDETMGTTLPVLPDDERAPTRRVDLPAIPAEQAPNPSPRSDLAGGKELPKLIANHFEGQVGRRIYVQVDKSLYKPGETIWFKTWDLTTRALIGADSGQMTVELVSPKGAVVVKKRLRVVAGTASNDFELPVEVQGGKYTLRATSGDGLKAERAVIVSAYEAPRMKKKLEFTKKAYGAGDQVSAMVEIKRPTGEALGAKTVTAVVTVDGVELPRVNTVTNADGGTLVKFNLPATINSGEGLLTLLIEDGGITESISKSIPILQKKLSLAFFPEGGKMVAGLPTRLYFEAKTPLGKPADVDGHLVDDLGNTVAQFSTYKNGLGRIEFTPATGRTYQAQISRPSSVTEKYSLPLSEDKGCVLRSYDDFDGQEKALRVAVQCSEKQRVVVAATVRENLLDVAAVEVDSDTPAVVYLRAKDAALECAAGVARVTVFDQNLNPLAERLVFRNRRARLKVTVEPDRKSYAPRGQVALTITTRDAGGHAVPAELALSVVDDTVISFADDKSGHLLSKLLLEPELPGKIEDPNFYTDLSEAKSGRALDMLMGARGYRRFDWMPVLRPAPMVSMAPAGFLGEDVKGVRMFDQLRMAVPAPMPAAPPAALAAMKPQAAPPPLRDERIDQKFDAPKRQAEERGQLLAAPELKKAIAADVAQDDPLVRNEIVMDKDFSRAAAKMQVPLPQEQAWATVRVFPIPAFNPSYAGPRDDYRETVFWAPSVKTDVRGRANVKFVLSDAVTSFRVLSEGVGGGAAGHTETVFKSALPFSLSAKLPLEVSAGDKPLIPVTLTNESDGTLDVALDSSFGSLIKSSGNPGQGGTLGAGQRKSFFMALDVTGTRGQSEVKLAAKANGLRDEVLRSIAVAPLGFPQLFEKSGQIKTEVSHELDLRAANPGSVQASIRVYTSPLSTMVSGLEGMLREPNGCFEQTSSTNYPNVMIMQYLKQHDVADPALLERTNKLLDSGYKKLSGFESPKKGYEWFGGDPGHEALTAYGLLEFADMKDVYGTVDTAMLARTAAWLKSRRDGSGGYLRDAKALDSFGRAAPEVTDAYITWALVSAGETGLDMEIAKSSKLAESTSDAYQLALVAGTLLERGAGSSTHSKAALAAASKLVAMQDSNGAWTRADHSITRSGGGNLHIETTSLAVLALLKAPGQLESARKGIAWLQANRSGFGQWGATQATVLALKAMIAFDNAIRVAPSAGTVTLLIDGVVVREQRYESGQREPILFADFDERLTTGQHRITLRSKEGNPLPYSLAVEYRSTQPASSNAAVVKLDASLSKADVKMGETVHLNAVVTNKTTSGQPMTLARLGLPGGLTFQNWQLKELRDKGQIAFFETRAREVILYFRDMKPAEVKKLGLDLVATVPGNYTGPASSAYLYYNDSDKSWAAPLEIKIAP